MLSREPGHVEATEKFSEVLAVKQECWAASIRTHSTLRMILAAVSSSRAGTRRQKRCSGRRWRRDDGCSGVSIHTLFTADGLAQCLAAEWKHAEAVEMLRMLRPSVCLGRTIRTR